MAEFSQLSKLFFSLLMFLDLLININCDEEVSPGHISNKILLVNEETAVEEGYSRLFAITQVSNQEYHQYLFHLEKKENRKGLEFLVLSFPLGLPIFVIFLVFVSNYITSFLVAWLDFG